MVEYSEELCKERHKHLDGKVDVLFRHKEKIQKIMYGNGQEGLSSKFHEMYKWYTKQLDTRSGRLDWVYRIIIGIVLAYIAKEVGLK